MNQLNGKVVFITGASSGIGAACARVFYDEGASLALMARGIDSLIDLAQEQQFLTNRIVLIQGDVSVELDCNRAVKEITNAFGTVDILISNAGISMRGAFDQTKQGVLEAVMNTNFWGLVYTTRYSLPFILKQQGSVVAISSITGIKGLPGRTGYAASKFAIHGFMESIRMEYYKLPIHFGIVAPGFTSSNIRKVALLADGDIQEVSPRDESKMMSPLQVAQKVLDCVLKRRKLVVLTRTGKWVYYLNKLVPAWVESRIYQVMKKEPNAPFK